MDDIPVLGIHEIAFEVRDLQRSIAFYRVWRCLLTIEQAVANTLHCLSHRKKQTRRAML